MPIFFYEDNVAKRAAHLTGGVRPCGIEGNMLCNWILCHEFWSRKLREVIGHWTELLSNESPPYAIYQGINACHQLAVDKRPIMDEPNRWLQQQSGTIAGNHCLLQCAALCRTAIWYRGQPSCCTSCMASIYWLDS